ncbi:MAG: class I SAM-dependent methyltransferase [Thermoguttaceae bacterium]|nr:class I SAM-dependent methyltransferase [Thermoguttaceae bacterium]
MSFFTEFQTICGFARHAFRRSRAADSNADRVESFYKGNADAYDAYRNKFLSGRAELWSSLGVKEGGVWVDLGGGTGMNLLNFGENIAKFRKIYVVDLSRSMLDVAQKRIDANGWTNVEAVEADATAWTPSEGAADFVTFSYSLAMIPDWFAAIDHASAILAPGGKIGVVDFYSARKYPANGFPSQGWTKRNFWPTWFAFDDVFIDCDHAPYLARKFETLDFRVWEDRIPYFPIPWWKTPRYSFIGRKPLVEMNDDLT